MFQDYMLFPHKNVFGNVSFGLEMLGWGKEKIELRVNEILEFVGILEYKFRDVSTLSGGEQQRTALARSLAPFPSLLLLDEPFSSLDRTLRDRLLNEMSIILREMNQTSVYVTHDQEEAFALSNQVVVINQGRVQQIGPPEEIYMYPKTEFVARFLGFTNIFTALIQDKTINFPFGSFPLNKITYSSQNINPLDSQRNVKTLIRPEAIKIHSTGDQNFMIECMVRERNFRGNFCRLVVEKDKTLLSLYLPTTSTIPKENEKIKVFINPLEAIHLLENE